MCYFPHYLWKSWEGGKLNMLIQGMDGLMLDGEGEKFRDRRSAIVHYFFRTFRTHNSYVYKFILCEVLNLVNILLQV